MQQPDADFGALFEQAWLPQAYLQTYYPSDHLTADERAILEYLVGFFRSAGRRFERAIEVGCGPTIHHALPVAPHVRELHMADFVPSNLAAIETWLHGQPGAHDWDLYVRSVLEIERPGRAVTARALARRRQLLRRRIGALSHVDLRRTQPLGESALFDLVLSFYCADSATSSRHEWQRLMRHLLTLLSPGGTVIVSALRHARQYTIAEQQFPSARIDESDLAGLFAELGFRAADVDIRVVEVAAWSDFSSVIIARASNLPRAIAPGI